MRSQIIMLDIDLVPVASQQPPYWPHLHAYACDGMLPLTSQCQPRSDYLEGALGRWLVQFEWGGTSSADPPMGYVLSSTGHLLEGKLGSGLLPWHGDSVTHDSTCTAASSDNQMLAVAAAAVVTINAPHCSCSF